MSKFNFGDKVKYISKCRDHHRNVTGKLILNEIYTVEVVRTSTVFLKECRWWVKFEHLELVNKHDPNLSKLELICIKKKELDDRFKSRQLSM